MKIRNTNKSKDLAGFKVDNNISYRSYWSDFGPAFAPSHPSMSRSKPDQIVPIDNIPIDTSAESDCSSVPSKRDFTIYRLKRQNAALRENEKQLLNKLTRCLLTLTEEKRFLENGLIYSQWESFDELMQRKARLTATLALIQDPNAEPDILSREELEKQKLKL